MHKKIVISQKHFNELALSHEKWLSTNFKEVYASFKETDKKFEEDVRGCVLDLTNGLVANIVLDKVCLVGAFFKNTTFYECEFKNVTITACDFSEAIFIKCKFGIELLNVGCNLINMDFSNTILIDTDDDCLNGCDCNFYNMFSTKRFAGIRRLGLDLTDRTSAYPNAMPMVEIVLDENDNMITYSEEEFPYK